MYDWANNSISDWIVPAVFVIAVVVLAWDVYRSRRRKRTTRRPDQDLFPRRTVQSVVSCFTSSSVTGAQSIT